jgi:hypothetical protein
MVSYDGRVVPPMWTMVDGCTTRKRPKSQWLVIVCVVKSNGVLHWASTVARSSHPRQSGVKLHYCELLLSRTHGVTKAQRVAESNTTYLVWIRWKRARRTVRSSLDRADCSSSGGVRIDLPSTGHVMHRSTLSGLEMNPYEAPVICPAASRSMLV